MKRKNWLIGALWTVALACGSFAFSSCGGNGGNNVSSSSVDSSSSSADSSAQHTHTYGAWTTFTNDDKACEERFSLEPE